MAQHFCTSFPYVSTASACSWLPPRAQIPATAFRCQRLHLLWQNIANCSFNDWRWHKALLWRWCLSCMDSVDFLKYQNWPVSTRLCRLYSSPSRLPTMLLKYQSSPASTTAAQPENIELGSVALTVHCTCWHLVVSPISLRLSYMEKYCLHHWCFMSLFWNMRSFSFTNVYADITYVK